MDPSTDDEADVRLRVRMFWVGIWSSYVLCGTQLVWVLSSMDQPHRPWSVGLTSASLLATLAMSRLPIERIVRGPHRESFFLSWSMSLVVIVTLGAIFDGGARSPAVAAFFLTSVYAALSYPLRSVALIGVLSVVGFVATAVIGDAGGTRPGHILAFAVGLALVSAQCVFQARLHEQRRAELRRLSSADPLTGALNRRGFGERVDAALATAARDGSEVALLVLDLDHFKALNDAQGHAAGDRLLCDLVREAASAVRAQDAVGRLGGDEFAVLLPGSDADEAGRVAVRIADALPAAIGVSYGVAVTPRDGATSDALHRHADERLYACKRANRLVVPA